MAICEDIDEVFKEARGNGLDVKAIKEVIKLRKIQAHELKEFEFLVETYKTKAGI